MSTSRIAGLAALLAAPPVVIASVLVRPTISDEASKNEPALAAHRGAMIAGMALGTLALVLLMAGMIWLALELAPRAPGLALAGGILGVLGSLVVLFEDGIAAAAPSVVHGMSSGAAMHTLHRIESSAAVKGLEPLSVLGDIGLALLGAALVKAGARKWTGIAIALAAFGEGAGFATATRGLVVAAFVVLFVALVQAVRVLVDQSTPPVLPDVAPSY